jgi:hypothetical protein
MPTEWAFLSFSPPLYNFLNPSGKSEKITFDQHHGFALSLTHQLGFAADQPGLRTTVCSGNFAPSSFWTEKD